MEQDIYLTGKTLSAYKWDPEKGTDIYLLITINKPQAAKLKLKLCY